MYTLKIYGMTLALASTSFGDFKLDHDSVPRGDQPIEVEAVTGCDIAYSR